MARPLTGIVLLLGVSVGLAAFAFSDALALMIHWWQRDEYSHSYIVPLIAAFLFWQRLPKLDDGLIKPSWLGFGLSAIALALCVVGEFSAIYTVVQYGFILFIAALVVTVFGIRGAWAVSAALVYLLFLVPLPNFLYNNLSQTLQLLSSEIGVMVIRLLGISVHLEGNVIDLGTYKLQVVEACSGLRYLFPLLSFGFLVACLFQAPPWHRAVLLLSTIPITVLMNSFRIGVVGILVEYWGIGMADGFLHYFEGWVIFIACLAVLYFVMWSLLRLTGDSSPVPSRIDLALPGLAQFSPSVAPGLRAQAPLIATVLLVAAFALGTQGIETREEEQPTRTSLLQFPLLHGGWLGHEVAIEQPILESLQLTDYLMADYRHPDYRLPVNLYVAYYASQRKGASIHSPRSCIPGGGWLIENLTQIDIDASPGMSTSRASLRVNRAVIAKGNDRQLVYYWFKQRDRILTNEYLLKWYLFWDSLTRNRTDGALVRMMIPMPDGIEIPQAEAQLQRFVADVESMLVRYVPD